MSMYNGNEEAVRTEFQKQAKGFANQALSLNSEVLLKWIHQSLSLHEDDRVMDVAAGTGILSRFLAPYVRKVVSVDLSPDMIREGEERNQAGGFTNITYSLAHVEQLPSTNETFELVISRLAFHHFTNPANVLQEMTRVCTSSGTVCVVDMMASEEDKLYRLYNHYERLRDPSHTYALKETEFVTLFKNAGLEIQTIETIEVPINVKKWLELTATAHDVAHRIIQDIELDIAGELTTGLSPYLDNGELMFKQKWIKVLGKR